MTSRYDQKQKAMGKPTLEEGKKKDQVLIQTTRAKRRTNASLVLKQVFASWRERGDRDRDRDRERKRGRER